MVIEAGCCRSCIAEELIQKQRGAPDRVMEIRPVSLDVIELRYDPINRMSDQRGNPEARWRDPTSLEHLVPSHMLRCVAIDHQCPVSNEQKGRIIMMAKVMGYRVATTFRNMNE